MITGTKLEDIQGDTMLSAMLAWHEYQDHKLPYALINRGLARARQARELGQGASGLPPQCTPTTP